MTHNHSNILNPTGTERPLRCDGESPHEPDTAAPLGARPDTVSDALRGAPPGGPLDERAHLLDADADMRKRLHHLLGELWNVETAGDGEAALAAIHRRRPGLLITNAAMPGLDGRGLVRAIRDDPGLLPVIVLCAGAAERPGGLETGPDDDLEKPFSAREPMRANRKLAKVRQRVATRHESERRHRAVTHALPVVCTTDREGWFFRKTGGWLSVELRRNAAEGYITSFNQTAANLAGRRPIPARDRWCVTSKLYRADGRPIEHAHYPLAVAPRERRPVGGEEAVLARGDGTRRSFVAFATPICDQAGTGVNVLSDITERRQAEDRQPRNELWLSGQKEGFRVAMDGASLGVSPGILARTAKAADDRRCAFYPDGSGSLRHVVGKPESCARAVDGLAISPESNCGLAVTTGKPIIVRDRDEPGWQSLLPIAEEYDYRGVWSFPVETVLGTVAGTFRDPGGMQQ